jgi:hypothetical protein
MLLAIKQSVDLHHMKQASTQTVDLLEKISLSFY